MNSRARAFLACVSALLIGPACQQKPHEIGPGAKSGKAVQDNGEQKLLALNDMKALADGESEREAKALEEFDRSHGRIYTRVFGGSSKSDVKRFVDARIKYFVTAGELRSNGVEPEAYGFSQWPGENPDPKIAAKGADIAAFNFGVLLWVSGLIRGEKLAFPVPGVGPVPVESPRVGIMMLAAGYRPTTTIKFKNGGSREVAMPTVIRQSAIIHEARHSDCAGGLKAAEIEHMRAARDFRIPHATCGYQHAECPRGHDLAGIAACDTQPWGAYAVEAVFLEGALAVLKADEQGGDQVTRAMLESSILDFWGRVQISKDEILSGSHGEPDIADEEGRE